MITDITATSTTPLKDLETSTLVKMANYCDNTESALHMLIKYNLSFNTFLQNSTM